MMKHEIKMTAIFFNEDELITISEALLIAHDKGMSIPDTLKEWTNEIRKSEVIPVG